MSDQSYPPPLQRPLPPPNGNHGGQSGGSNQGSMLPQPNQAYRVQHPASSHPNAPVMMRSQQQPSRYHLE